MSAVAGTPTYLLISTNAKCWGQPTHIWLDGRWYRWVDLGIRCDFDRIRTRLREYRRNGFNASQSFVSSYLLLPLDGN